MSSSKNLYEVNSNHHIILCYLKMVRDWTSREELKHFSFKIAKARKDVLDRTMKRLVENGHARYRLNAHGYDEWVVTPAGIQYVLLMGQYRALLPGGRNLKDDLLVL